MPQLSSGCGAQAVHLRGPAHLASLCVSGCVFLAVCIWTSETVEIGDRDVRDRRPACTDMICPSQSRVLGLLRYFPCRADKVRAGPIPILRPSRPGVLWLG